MSEFYTHFHSVRDSILVRGYRNGKPFNDNINYDPYIFVTSKKDSEFKTIDGRPVAKLHCGTMSDAKQYIQDNTGIAGHEIYGLENFQYQYINDMYSGEIKYDPSLISVVTLDIETDSEGGFPDIATANKAITAITLRRNDRVITYGLREYKEEGNYPYSFTYVKCNSEQDMLQRFLDTWNLSEWMPDIITGWNVEFFDIPYIINRIRLLFDEKMARRLSPWRLWEKRRNPNVTETLEYMDVPLGISVLDYMQLYKKFKFEQQESYKLDYIATKELGEQKLDWHSLGFETLDEFYKKDFQNFINYNIRDVDLVYKLDQKMKFIEQVYAIAYDAKVNFVDSLTTVSMWDIIIHNYLLSKKQVIPLKTKKDKSRQIEGAYVKDPQVGLHEWVVSFDLNSLYPHLIMQYNISPEKLVGQLLEYDNSVVETSVDLFLNGELDRKKTQDEQRETLSLIKNTLYGLAKGDNNKQYMQQMKQLDHFMKYESVRDILNEYNLTITPTGCLFDRSEKGFLSELMETMYNDRSLWKKRMLEAKKQYEKKKDRETENEIARCHNMQLAKKIQLNSAYGAMSNEYFRWFDNRLAESITKSGQLSIRWMEKKMNDYLNKILETSNEDYVIAIDTDSMYIRFGKLIEKLRKGYTVEENVAYLDKVCQQIIEPFIDKNYQTLATYVNAFDQKMKMKREAIANKGIWTGKKHYILNVYDLEGVRYTEPKLKIQGIEAVRSSTPSACRESIKQALSIIMNQNEESIQHYIQQLQRDFKNMTFEEIAFPRSVRGLLKEDVYDKQGRLIQKSYYTGDSSFKKATPIHVKAALMYNRLLKLKNIENKYTPIGEGEKIKFCYILDSSPLPVNVIASPGSLPKEFDIEKYIDYDLQFEKAFLDPIRTIMKVIGWQDGTNQQTTLDSFF